MLSIVGTRLYMHEGDSCAFRVMYRDKSGVFDFNPAHSLSFVARDIVTGETALVKQSEYMSFKDSTSLVFKIYPNEIPKGDYIYEMILTTEAGDSYTLIDRAFLNVLKSSSSTSQVSYQGRLVMSNTPLICDFNSALLGPEVIVGGSIILFDKELNELD